MVEAQSAGFEVGLDGHGVVLFSLFDFERLSLSPIRAENGGEIDHAAQIYFWGQAAGLGPPTRNGT